MKTIWKFKVGEIDHGSCIHIQGIVEYDKELGKYKASGGDHKNHDAYALNETEAILAHLRKRLRG